MGEQQSTITNRYAIYVDDPVTVPEKGSGEWFKQRVLQAMLDEFLEECKKREDDAPYRDK